MKKIKIFIKSKSKVILAFFAIAIIPIFSGCGGEVTQGTYKADLEIWGTFDDSTTFKGIIEKYKEINPYVGEIKYRKFSQQTYRKELIEAIASGQAPDIFMINNGWLPSFEDKLQPAPTPLMSTTDLSDNFVDVVSGDFVSGGKAYAVPLSVDSLALFYNKDMFNAAGITEPPKTWLEFQENVKQLTKLNSDGNFNFFGAAIGTGINVSRSPDLVSLLMLQNGANLPTKKGEDARFDEGLVGSDGKVIQVGEQAMGFYTQFAKSGTSSIASNPLYTWNSRQKNSIEAFAEGRVGMTVNYSWQIEEILNKNAKLNFEVTAVPQVYPDRPVNVANYWGYAVSKNKTAVAVKGNAPISNEVRTHEAWQFLRFLTLKNSGKVTLYNAISKKSAEFPVTIDPAVEYLKKTKQPAARRDIIETQLSDQNMRVFALGNLIAKHWYQFDSDSVDKILIETIEAINRGDVSLREALSIARNKVNYLSR